MNILAITQEDPINYSSLGLVRFMFNLPALFWFPFSVDEMLVNCDSLQPFAVVSHLNFRNSCNCVSLERLVQRRIFTSHFQCSVRACEYRSGGPLLHPLAVFGCLQEL